MPFLLARVRSGCRNGATRSRCAARSWLSTPSPSAARACPRPWPCTRCVQTTCYLAKPLLSRCLTGGTRCGRGREREHLLQGAIGPVLAVAEGTAVADLESVKQAVFMLGSLSEVSSRHAPKSSGVPLNLRPCPPCSSSPVIKCSLKLSAWSRVHLLVRTKLGG
jgi:hypothetical protein